MLTLWIRMPRFGGAFGFLMFHPRWPARSMVQTTPSGTETTSMRLVLQLMWAGALAAIAASASTAQEPFYKGKQIRIVISAGVSGGYNEYARLLAIHMGNHIPGRPDFIVQSMPGAGGLLATNYLYAQAPQDGTTLRLIHSSGPLAPLSAP